jgi:hypothetical protein
LFILVNLRFYLGHTPTSRELVERGGVLLFFLKLSGIWGQTRRGLRLENFVENVHG